MTTVNGEISVLWPEEKKNSTNIEIIPDKPKLVQFAALGPENKRLLVKEVHDVISTGLPRLDLCL